jgi:hypothetical protein
LASSPLNQNSIVDLLGSLFVISLFLERAQEVAISAWRDFGKRQLQPVGKRLAKADTNDEANLPTKSPWMMPQRRSPRHQSHSAPFFTWPDPPQ